MKKVAELSKQELANVITHGFGILLSVVGIPVLMTTGVNNGQWHDILGLSIFCFCLLFVYSASTLYHSFVDERMKHVFRVIDYISIYFMIAGSYTPFVLLYLKNSTGLIFLIIMWLMVFVGVIYTLFFKNRKEWLSLLFYLVMGWMAVFILKPIIPNMTDDCFFWVIIGGASYMIGVIFYVLETIPYNHAIWHIFVLGGSVGHFTALMYSYSALGN